MDKWEKFKRTYSKGDIIFKCSDNEKSLLVIHKGRVKLKRRIEDKIYDVGEFSKGDIITFNTFAVESTRVYIAEALDDETVLIEIPQNLFSSFIYKNPEISLKVIRKISTLLLRTENEFRQAMTIVNTIQSKEGKKEVEKKQLPLNIRAYFIVEKSMRKVELLYTKTIIGRRDLSTGFVPDIDLSEEDKEKYISRRHAIVFFDQGEFYVKEEIGVINGTFLNGEKLKTNVPYKLKNGDVLRLCHLNLLFKFFKE